MSLPQTEKEEMRRAAADSAEPFSAESFARKVEAVYETERERHARRLRMELSGEAGTVRTGSARRKGRG
ncbi:hypothetical protein B5E77_15560 [Lachnoclostridium sp. An131]|uniref:hypothetical protein n=1 Tax=Lachnoclostridium sp. An131 TaxID=1965555 RepID=UPI000B39FB61|nr:hypothetical protein [Lachnoclostridium sp. An131]OUQ23471.1 hypothetical protein B5E77_15560 [Lachnoclostridium sp. An131]